MSPESSSAAALRSVNNSKLNINDEFFIKSATITNTHPKFMETLLTDSVNDGEVQSVAPGHIMRFFLQKKEYPASPIDFKIWLSPFRFYDKWMKFMMIRDHVKANLTEAQIMHAVMASAVLQIRKDIVSLITFISRWCPKTHTTIGRWGEITISLETLAVLLSLPMIGKLDVVLSEEEEEMHVALVTKAAEYVRKNEERCFYNWWVSEWFPDEPKSDQVLDDTLHVALFLILWLSRDVLDDGSGKKEVRQKLVKFAIKLAKGIALPIDSLFLGSLYTHLDHLVEDMYISNGYMKVDSYIHVAFLQAWLWEHFKYYDPNLRTLFPDAYGGSKILHWLERHPKPDVKLIDFLDNSHAVNFRPWSPVHASILQPKTFSSAPKVILCFDDGNMGIGKTMFLRRCISGYVPSFFRRFCGVVCYNIDRASQHMGFEQGVSFRFPLTTPDESLPAILDYNIFAPDKSLPFLLPE